MKTVVIITGKAQSGKDTAADYLIEKYPDLFEKFSFAFTLKEFLANNFNIDRQLLYGDNNAKNQLTHIKWSELPFPFVPENQTDPTYLSVRELLIYFGTYVCRKIFHDIWVVGLINHLKTIDTNKHIILTDVRFPNELKAFLHDSPYQSLMSHIDLNNTLVVRLLRNTTKINDVSETSLDQYNFGELNSLVLDNSNMSVSQKNTIVEHFIIRNVTKVQL